MKNPWMDAWLKAMNTTLSATQAFWNGLMRGQAPATKPVSSQDTDREISPTPPAKKPGANAETSPAGSKASSEPTSPSRTGSRVPAAAPKEAAAAKGAADSTKDAQPKKAAPQNTAAAGKTAGAKGTAGPKTAPSKQKAGGSAAAKDNPAASAPKFQHPTDPGLTWSGRGRRPRWVTEALEAGRTLDDLRVRKR